MADEQRSRDQSRGMKRKAAGSPSSPSRKRPGMGKSQSGGSRPHGSNSTSGPANHPGSEPARSPPRKRPGARAGISKAQQEAARQRALQRENELQEEARKTREGVQDAVTQHYNLVPERGRDWRKTASRIKGLRSYNNWVKSCVINKFSRDELQGQHHESLKVLDIGCGKGGDLQKWQSAPQRVGLYVGLDPADVSITQARERYVSMQKSANERRHNGRRAKGVFHGEFIVRDCFGKSLEEVPIIREVGFEPGVGSGQIQRWGGGGFDIVTMMFCLHYSFESEEKARCMLRNVAGSLKKGGRFMGVIPNSAVLTEKVLEHHKMVAEKKALEPAGDADDGEWDPERSLDDSSKKPANGFPSAANDADDDDWDPEKSLDKRPDAENGTIRPPWDDDDEWDPEKSLDVPEPETKPAEAEETAKAEEKKKQEGFEWGNTIYRVKFPGATPADGVFRPPFGWKYFYFLEEAVEEVPEYVVPWEAFRALAEEYNLELQYRKPFAEVWDEEKDDPFLGPLSERMGVRGRERGPLLISKEEMEAASFYHAFCFYKV